MQGDVHLDVSSEGVSSLVQKVPDHRLVLVLAGPDQGGPAPVILDVNVVPGQVVGPQQDVAGLQVSVLSCQVERSHAIVTLQTQRCPGCDQVTDDVGETLRQATVSNAQLWTLSTE